MNHKSSFALFFFLNIFAAVLVARPPIVDPVIGEMNVSSSMIRWQASGSYERLTLTVSGPDGLSLTRDFPFGTTPSLRLQDLAANVPADGSYVWEIRVVPRVSADTRQRLAEARKADDDAAVSRIQTEAGIDHEIRASGGFTIRNGSFVTNNGQEQSAALRQKITANTLKPAPNNVVTADNEIIQGSLCVGLDCVSTESFGFDTLRLKENNTRITFLDTSTSAGFPNNVWTLTANDSCSGCLNKFSIDDVTGGKTPFTVIAGAPTNSLWVASNGKVGLGNSSPGLNLHITATDTPAIRQEQTSGGGFTAQTWDIGANEANWFVRDLTGGSRLPLRIRPGAPTSSIDIAASGNVGIGTASPARKIHAIGPLGPVAIFPSAQIGPQDVEILENRGNINFALIGGPGNYSTLRFTYDGATSYGYVRYFHDTNDLVLGTTSADRVRVTSTGLVGIGVIPTQPIQHSNGAFLSAGGVWTNASSRDLKQDICDLDSAAAKKAFDELAPVTFAYKAAPAEHHAGFIAEDSPELVVSKDRKGMSAMDVAAVLTRVIKDQQTVIEELEKRVERLEKRINESRAGQQPANDPD